MIVYNSDGKAVSFVGHDATRLYKANAIYIGLGLLLRGIKPSRQWTVTNTLAAVTPFTGQHYKRSKAEMHRASKDLKVWIENMKLAMPVEVRS
jgi:hypothetical protein